MEDLKKPDIQVDYTSDFEYAESTSGNDTPKVSEIYKKPKTVKNNLVIDMKKEQYEKDYIKNQSASYRAHIISMDKMTRHNKLVHDYVAFTTKMNAHIENVNEDKRESTPERHQRFLWHDGDERESWGSRLAKRYWDRLVKEYILIDLSRYEMNKFGMRWRREQEVINGKGQFICANIDCSGKQGLTSWLVKFNYREKNEKRSVLVKVRLCTECSEKLNFRHRRQKVSPSFTTTKLHLKRPRLQSPIPLDDDIMDQDTIHNSVNLSDIRRKLKRARRESNRSLTCSIDHHSDNEESYSSGAESFVSSSTSLSNSNRVSVNTRLPLDAVSVATNDAIAENDKIKLSPKTSSSFANTTPTRRRHSNSDSDSVLLDNISTDTSITRPTSLTISPGNHQPHHHHGKFHLLASSGASSPVSVSSIEDDQHISINSATTPVPASSVNTSTTVSNSSNNGNGNAANSNSGCDNKRLQHPVDDFEPFIEELFP